MENIIRMVDGAFDVRIVAKTEKSITFAPFNDFNQFKKLKLTNT